MADTDSFAGGSGGPLYNEALELMGHQVRGELDWKYEDGCARHLIGRAPHPRTVDAGEHRRQRPV
ncbi:MAG TPA: hypothetical protein VI197_20835 [Polyangiaceae bacterium]